MKGLSVVVVENGAGAVGNVHGGVGAAGEGRDAWELLAVVWDGLQIAATVHRLEGDALGRGGGRKVRVQDWERDWVSEW